MLLHIQPPSVVSACAVKDSDEKLNQIVTIEANNSCVLLCSFRQRVSLKIPPNIHMNARALGVPGELNLRHRTGSPPEW